MIRTKLWLVALSLVILPLQQQAKAQTYGIELHNNVMPASGGMGGASFSRPQDVQSAIYGNPATMTQYAGTVFAFGGTFIEPTVDITQTESLPLVGVDPYSAKSDTPSTLATNIGVIHQQTFFGRPVTLGLGLLTNAGLGVDFRPVANSNGTHANYTAIDLVTGFAVDLTQRLSFGSSFTLGTSFLTGPFAGTSSLSLDYGVRFSVGANYDLGNGFSLGSFWQSKKHFQFENVLQPFGIGPFFDLDLDHPQNVGIGIANRCLMNGRLLVAADVLYMNWADTDFFGALYQDQWAVQFGTQYLLTNRLKLRSGYAWNEDPTRDTVPGDIEGIPVGGVPSVQYIQGQFAAISQHRLTGGIGIAELLPGMDFDLSVGGIFPESKSFGATTSDLVSYFVSFGFTWRRGCCSYGGQSCCQSGGDLAAAPMDDWADPSMLR